MTRPISLALLLLAGSARAVAQNEPPPTVVRTAPVLSQQLQEHRRFTGTLRAKSRGEIAALEDGRLVELAVREGATIRAGQTLARIDDRRLQAEKKELLAAKETAHALIEQRRAEVLRAENDLARTERLLKNRAVAQEEYQHREADLAVAKAVLVAEERRLSQIESQIEHVQVRLDDTAVDAPFDGKVIERHAEKGEWIRAGEPLVTLVSNGQIEAWLEVPERFADSVRLDVADLRVQFEGLKRGAAAVEAKRIPQVHPQARTFHYVLTLDDSDGLLTAGMSVTAWIPVGSDGEYLTVPKDAVIRSDRLAYVFKASGDESAGHRALQTPVKVLFETGQRVAIGAEALKAGDQVVVEGNERIIPGSAISLAPTRSERQMHAGLERERR